MRTTIKNDFSRMIRISHLGYDPSDPRFWICDRFFIFLNFVVVDVLDHRIIDSYELTTHKSKLT